MLQGWEHITSKVIDGKTVVAQGAGSFQGGGPKLGLHTTEGPKAEGAISTLFKNRSWSHFLLSFEENRKIQFLELNVAGKSMSNNTIDGYPTNRSNMIQVEIVGYAAEAVSWPKGKLDWLAQCFKEIRQQFNFPLNHLDFVNGVRLSDQDFHNYKGIVGHKHAPDNNHWDPGQLNVPYIVSKIGEPPVKLGESKILGINHITEKTASVWGQIACNEQGCGLWRFTIDGWAAIIPNGSPVFRGTPADKNNMVFPLFSVTPGTAEMSVDVEGASLVVTVTGAPKAAVFQMWVPVAKG